MATTIPKATLLPPPGRPNWRGREDLPLLYLGWGKRDFARDPLPMHRDLGTNYYVLLRGEVVVTTTRGDFAVRGPTALVFEDHTAFGITKSAPGMVEILVWIWQGRPVADALRSDPAANLAVPLPKRSVDSLMDLHNRCRNEVARADAHLPVTLAALRGLMEVELLRARDLAPAVDDVRWNLAGAWMAANLSIQAPVPALCDYLRMSPSTLHRFFLKRTGRPPGACFRALKLAEARRLIHREGWQVKTAAYHLGYRHANDLSRALANHPDADGS